MHLSLEVIRTKTHAMVVARPGVYPHVFLENTTKVKKDPFEPEGDKKPRTTLSTPGQTPNLVLRLTICKHGLAGFKNNINIRN